LQDFGGTVPTATLSGQYRSEDLNLDGVVKYS
jgi:outer membrane protease